MARTRAVFLSAAWQDPDWVDLPPRAQWLYWLLLTQPKLTLIGVMDYMPGRWGVLARSMTGDRIEEIIDELEAARFVVVDRSTEEILIRTFVVHDGIEKANVNIRKGMWGAWTTVASPMLRKVAVDNMPESLWIIPGFTVPAEAEQMRRSEPMERPSEPPSERPSEPQSELTCSLLPTSSFLLPAADPTVVPEPAVTAQDRQRRIMEAARQVAEERAIGRDDIGPGWINGAARGIAKDHHQALHAHLVANPTATTLELMTIIDGPARTPRNTGGVISDERGVFLPGSGWIPRTAAGSPLPQENTG